MKRTRLFHPYAGPSTCKLNRTGAGVYFILERDWNDEFKLVYIGYSGYSVKQTMYRHFQKWTDKRHPDKKRTERIERVTYWTRWTTWEQYNKDYRCKVIFCNSADEAAKLEAALIAKLTPRDNSLKMAFDAEMKHYFNSANECAVMKNSECFVDDLPF